MRFKELRKQKKKTQKEVADYLGISESTYAGYEKERHDPDIKTLIKISDFFNVTIDYLVGRENNLSDLDHEFMVWFSQLNDLEKAKVIGYTKSRVEQQKEEQYLKLRNKFLSNTKEGE